MTVRKTFPARDYETFSSNASDAGQGSSETHSTIDSDKSRLSAAQEAQRLASQGSWADNVFRTPGTTMTPPSTVDEEERPPVQRNVEDDPPPLYTPTDTTANTMPSSPVAVREDQVGDSQTTQRPSTSTSARGEDVVEDQPIHGTYTPSSPLLERGEQETYSHEHESIRWNVGHKHQRGRPLKRGCWFAFALAICLWLMLPAMFYHDKPNTRGPHHPHKPSDDLRESPIPTWPVPKREFRLHETSKSIHGTFQLYDLLDLETTSGSIQVTVEPKPGDKPAVMRLKTSSGSINIKMADSSWLPWVPTPKIDTNRTLDIKIATTSGSISGSVLAANGGSTELSTRSGSHGLNVYVVGAGKNGNTTRLLTSSGSGSQGIKVIANGDELRMLEAKHLVAGSASMSITYPDQWVGKVHASVDGSGHVSMSGSDLETQGGGSNYYGWRGDGDLKEVEVHARGSGSIRFSC